MLLSKVEGVFSYVAAIFGSNFSSAPVTITSSTTSAKTAPFKAKSAVFLGTKLVAM